MSISSRGNSRQKRSAIVTSCLFFGCVLGSAVILRADLKSGPAEGTAVPGFRTLGITGELAKNPAEEIDFVEIRKKKTTVFLFVAADKWDRPVARYLKTLDKSLNAGAEGEGVEAVAVWLTEDVQKSKEYLPLAQGSLMFGHTALTVYPGKKQGPDGWGLDIEAHLTTVIVQDGKVIASFGYRSTNETDVPAVIQALKKKP